MRENIIPEQVGAPSEGERIQEDFEKLTPEQKQSIINVARITAERIEKEKEEERRKHLLQKGVNPDQGSLKF